MLDPERFAEWRRTHPPIMGADDGTVPVNGRSPIARAMTGGVLLRADNEDGDNPDDGRTLFGHFSVFNRWTEIDSWIEGHFMERIAPGAFKKTFREKTPKVLFQHGMDPQIADQPIASVRELREDDEGAYYEARLFDGVPPLVLEGLRAGEYGASFRFTVMREEWVEDPDPSDGNPHGLRERTIKEARVAEFGPVTFPAYEEATAGVRSLTDELVLGRMTSDPERLRALLEYLERRDQRAERATPPTEAEQQDTAPPTDRAERDAHPVEGRREHQPTKGRLYGLQTKEKSWRL
jgi:HK97 family phage prohead protease